MLSGAMVGVGKGRTETYCGFSSFLPSNEGLAGRLKKQPPLGRGQCTRHIGHSGWEKCGYWRLSAAELKSTLNKGLTNLGIRTRL